jgi:hypothetical protein
MKTFVRLKWTSRKLTLVKTRAPLSFLIANVNYEELNWFNFIVASIYHLCCWEN